METVLIVVCVLLIAIVLLQAGKVAEGDIFTGANSELFKNRKERGGELFITRTTFILGAIYFIICFIQGF